MKFILIFTGTYCNSVKIAFVKKARVFTNAKFWLLYHLLFYIFKKVIFVIKFNILVDRLFCFLKDYFCVGQCTHQIVICIVIHMCPHFLSLFVFYLTQHQFFCVTPYTNTNTNHPTISIYTCVIVC